MPTIISRNMPVPADQIFFLLVLLLFAFSSNLPLGYWRETRRKYSLSWFILIHLSIPFIILLRSAFGFSWPWIPLTLFCAIIGQLLGGRARKRRLG